MIEWTFARRLGQAQDEVTVKVMERFDQKAG
jgi:hypothetical protein